MPYCYLQEIHKELSVAKIAHVPELRFGVGGP